MDKAIAFVDVGFLRGGGLARLHRQGERPKPGYIGQGVVDALALIASQGKPPSYLLRTFWYDGEFPSNHQRLHKQQQAAHREIARTPGIRLRLGHVQQQNPKWHHAVKEALDKCGGSARQDFEKHFQFRPLWEQKGVDVLIAFDLVRLAQERAFDTAILMTGDRDLAKPVSEIQFLGRRVVLVTPSVKKGTSIELLEIADDVHELSESDLQGMFKASAQRTTSPGATVVPSSDSGQADQGVDGQEA